MTENNAAARLLAAAVGGEGELGAAKVAYEITGLGVSIVDPLYRPIAFYAPGVEEKDCERKDDDDPVSRKHWMELMRQSDEPRIDSEGGAAYRAMCIDARSGGKSLAKVTFFELRPFREEDKAVLKLLAQVVACIRQGRAEQMTEIARYFQLFIGVSRDFSGLRYARAYYLQAEFAMRQAMKTRRDMMRYDECMLEDMIAHCRKERNLTTYCRPEILELMAYDAQNETDYAGTFRCYCENLCNMAQTARTSFLHDNTIKYRLKMVETITGISEVSARDLCEFLLTYAMLDAQKA